MRNSPRARKKKETEIKQLAIVCKIRTSKLQTVLNNDVTKIESLLYKVIKEFPEEIKR